MLKQHKLVIVGTSIHFRRYKGDNQYSFFEHKLIPGHVRLLKACYFNDGGSKAAKSEGA